jgi:hypothetical protein
MDRWLHSYYGIERWNNDDNDDDYNNNNTYGNVLMLSDMLQIIF